MSNKINEMQHYACLNDEKVGRLTQENKTLGIDKDKFRIQSDLNSKQADIAAKELGQEKACS